MCMYFPKTIYYNMPGSSAVDLSWIDPGKGRKTTIKSGLPPFGEYVWPPHHVYPTKRGILHVSDSSDPTYYVEVRDLVIKICRHTMSL